jgi:hypothetical protein
MKTTIRISRIAAAASLFILFNCAGLIAQQGFTYQAVARNASWEPLRNQDLSVKIAIHANDQYGELIWEEEHQQVRTNPVGLFSLTVGGPDATNQSGSAGSFDQINWSASPYYMKVWINSGGEFQDMGGSPIQTVPIAQYAATASSATTSFSIQPVEEAQEGEALFEVKRKDGQPVFAVYEDMVWVYVDTAESKGKKGGFAVGGYSRGTKGVTQEYIRVTPDSVRVYVSDDESKGKKGGFAVGGYSRSVKGSPQELLRISPDSIRVYIDTDGQAKGVKGGFAVGGYSRSNKGAANDLFFNLSPKDDAEVIANKSQILFYPAKDAFLAGTIHVGSPDSVGLNSTSLGYQSVAMGQYSQGFGYRSMALGDYSTAIGREAAAMENSFALGNTSKALGNDSYAFGSGARASGDKSFAFGSVGIDTLGIPTGVSTSATGNYSIAFGMGARALNTGAMSMGPSSTAEGFQSIAIGCGTSASGSYATGIGYRSKASGYKSISIGAHYSYIIYSKPTWPPSKPRTITRENSANGDYSISFGNGNYSNDGGLALGTYNNANDQGSVALGVSNTAEKKYSLAAGYNNDAIGYYSMAIGENLTSQSMNSFAIGRYNEILGDTAEWTETDPLFQIGNGSGTDDRHDAFRVDKSGRVDIYPVNAIYGNYVSSNYDADYGSTSAIGVRSIISRGKDDVTYYSGYFSDKGSLGTYNGLWADVRTGGAVDLAEYIYDTNGDTEAGDVLVADPVKSESVVKSSEPYQTSVLGVVSTKPHMVIGMELVADEETGQPIEGVSATRLALTGRVPVKVTEENGPIRPGDLLTTSSTPGYAMKWSLLDVGSARDFEELKSMLAENERRRNAVIGKAVGSSGTGTGTVMVLISLQ